MKIKTPNLYKGMELEDLQNYFTDKLNIKDKSILIDYYINKFSMYTLSSKYNYSLKYMEAKLLKIRLKCKDKID